MKEMGDMPRRVGHLAQHVKEGELFVCNLAAIGNLPKKLDNKLELKTIKAL